MRGITVKFITRKDGLGRTIKGYSILHHNVPVGPVYADEAAAEAARTLYIADLYGCVKGAC